MPDHRPQQRRTWRLPIAVALPSVLAALIEGGKVAAGYTQEPSLYQQVMLAVVVVATGAQVFLLWPKKISKVRPIWTNTTAI